MDSINLNVSDVQYIMNRTCLQKSNLTEERANSIIDHHLKNGKLLYYYKCPFCNSFHLTKKIPNPLTANKVGVR